jgi:hypothetical protein
MELLHIQQMCTHQNTILLLSITKEENKMITTTCVDEDGALARSFKFTELLLQDSITLETTGGYGSFLNGKVERPTTQ